MRYSVRQQHCLQAMGIVPWVSRLPKDAAVLASAAPRSVSADKGEPALADEVTVATETFTASLQPATTTGVIPLSETCNVQPPAEVNALGQWLLEQALVPIEFRGGLHPVLGVADAPLLVVLALDRPSPSAGSMAGDDGRLFELMLRSIALSNRDTRRCQLGNRTSEAATAGDDTVSQTGVSAVCAASTRGVLLLMSPWSFETSDTAVEQHQSRLPGSGLPLWRIAHPSILLEQPQFKRQAWQVLKRLRAVLDGDAL